jgi:hypothetical protein
LRGSPIGLAVGELCGRGRTPQMEALKWLLRATSGCGCIPNLGGQSLTPACRGHPRGLCVRGRPGSVLGRGATGVMPGLVLSGGDGSARTRRESVRMGAKWAYPGSAGLVEGWLAGCSAAGGSAERQRAKERGSLAAFCTAGVMLHASGTQTCQWPPAEGARAGGRVCGGPPNRANCARPGPQRGSAGQWGLAFHLWPVLSAAPG